MNNIAPNIIDFVNILSRMSKSGNLIVTLRQAKGRDLWLWWHEARCHEETETEDYARKLARAVAGKIADETLRRTGPRSVENPNGVEYDEAPETGTGDTQPVLALGGAVD